MKHVNNIQLISKDKEDIQLNIKQTDIKSEPKILTIVITISELPNEDLVILKSNWINNNSVINGLVIPNSIKYYTKKTKHIDIIQIKQTDDYYLLSDKYLKFTITNESGIVIPCKLNIAIYYN